MQLGDKETSVFCNKTLYITRLETKGRVKLEEKNSFMLGLGLVHFEPTQLRHGNQSPAEEWAKQKEARTGKIQILMSITIKTNDVE